MSETEPLPAVRTTLEKYEAFLAAKRREAEAA
jgi:hypothetical protein